jgi:hypothetical protein
MEEMGKCLKSRRERRSGPDFDVAKEKMMLQAEGPWYDV